MANYTLKDAPDYPAFGIAPQGVYGGPVDEVIPVPGPLEPAYAVLAEDFNAGGVNPAWVSGDRAGAGQLLVGDGTPAIPAEILFRGKLRIDTPPPAATGRFIMGVGDNTVVSDCGILQMYVQTFALKIDFGVNNTIKSQISFSTVHPIYAQIMSGAFNDIRIECKQSVAGLFQPADIVLKVNDVIQVPDGTGATVPGAFNGATAHYLALGGLNNNSATDCAWGDVTVSNDVTFDPDAPIIPPAPAENLPAGFVQDGAVIGFVADQDYTAGMIAIAGNFVGTIVASVKTGNVAGLRVIGTSLIDKVNAAEVIGAGTPVYVEPGSLKATATEAGNVFAGHAVLNSESGDAKVKTRLRQ